MVPIRLVWNSARPDPEQVPPSLLEAKALVESWLVEPFDDPSRAAQALARRIASCLATRDAEIERLRGA